MAHETFDDIAHSLDWLDDALSKTQPLHKSLGGLEAELDALHSAVADGRADRDDLMAALADGLNDIRRTMEQTDRTSRQALKAVALGLWGELRKLRKQAPAPTPATERYADLTKSVAALLPPGATHREALAITKSVIRHLGPRGGQVVPYSRDLDARLRVCEALTKAQHDIWQRTGRLPDGLNLAKPQRSPAVEREHTTAFNAGVLLSQLSPMFLQHVLSRAGLSSGR
jgi:hypothetical protein